MYPRTVFHSTHCTNKFTMFIRHYLFLFLSRVSQCSPSKKKEELPLEKVSGLNTIITRTKTLYNTYLGYKFVQLILPPSFWGDLVFVLVSTLPLPSHVVRIRLENRVYSANWRSQRSISKLASGLALPWHVCPARFTSIYTVVLYTGVYNSACTFLQNRAWFYAVYRWRNGAQTLFRKLWEWSWSQRGGRKLVKTRGTDSPDILLSPLSTFPHPFLPLFDKRAAPGPIRSLCVYWSPRDRSWESRFGYSVSGRTGKKWEMNIGRQWSIWSSFLQQIALAALMSTDTDSIGHSNNSNFPVPIDGMPLSVGDVDTALDAYLGSKSR